MHVLPDFTSAELECLDALAPLYQAFQEDIAVDDRADIAIHPVMRREKWNPPIPKHLAEFPMGEQRDGYWNAVSILILVWFWSIVLISGSIPMTLFGKPCFLPFEWRACISQMRICGLGDYIFQYLRR